MKSLATTLFTCLVLSSVTHAMDHGDHGQMADKTMKKDKMSNHEMKSDAMASLGGIEFGHVQMRAPIPGSQNTAVFFELKNTTDSDISFVSATSDIAKMVQIHNHFNVDGVMKMRQVPSVDVKKGESVMFKPGGLHIMVMGLNRTVKLNEKVDFHLITADGKKVELVAKVSDMKKMSH